MGQYYIEGWQIGQTISHAQERVITVSLTLTRDFFSIFMVTYLPTSMIVIFLKNYLLHSILVLMNFVNQALNYIEGDTKYDLIIAVNITCMMVLTSVYLSESTSLPSTSNIKPVEIWLLFNLSFPFLVILVNVVIQVRKQNQIKSLINVL